MNRPGWTSWTASLLPCVVSLARAKRAYDKIKSALDQVEATGYGIVMPGIDELTLGRPEIVRQGGQYGVRLSASAPSLHIIRANIPPSFRPPSAASSRAKSSSRACSPTLRPPRKAVEHEYLRQEPERACQRGCAGRNCCICRKEARARLQQTLERIINEGCDGLICILL